MARIVLPPKRWDGYCYKFTTKGNWTCLKSHFPAAMPKPYPTHWVPGRTMRARGTGSFLCSSGVLHAYTSPYAAVINDIGHVNYLGHPGARLWLGRYSHYVTGDGIKIGVRIMQILYRVPIPRMTREILDDLWLQFGRYPLEDHYESRYSKALRLRNAISSVHRSIGDIDEYLGMEKYQPHADRCAAIQEEYLLNHKRG